MQNEVLKVIFQDVFLCPVEATYHNRQVPEALEGKLSFLSAWKAMVLGNIV